MPEFTGKITLKKITETGFSKYKYLLVTSIFGWMFGELKQFNRQDLNVSIGRYGNFKGA